MLKVGLTGSIAVGKSYVCEILEEFGFKVLDADKVARQVVKPGTRGLNSIVEAFGSGILNEKGHLDRKSLGRIVFSDPQKRQLINSILHPLIIKKQGTWLNNLEKEGKTRVAVIDAALMIESESYKRFDEIVVVWCDDEVQLKRLMDRDSISREEALAKVKSQLSQQEKKEYASFLIDTTGGFGDTRTNTEKVARALIEIANKA
ncbi:MAG: dephospho-CoA kinase [Pyrinomonadaceae bacterium]|nr:dephospho-CoA kinase [Pyrinomonadaceae bacterium]